MKAERLTFRWRLTYDTESPFEVKVNWQNPSIKQIEDARDYIIKALNKEIERLKLHA